MRRRSDRVLALGVALLATFGCDEPGPEVSEPRFKATTERGDYRIEAWPQAGRIRIGSFEAWVISVSDASDQPVTDASLRVDGGMAAHGHGLPSQPEVSGTLAPGVYVLEGLKFSMAGEWTLIVDIQTTGRSARAVLTVPVAWSE
ncbi:MAG: FixH family protein [Myxococcota bacterium]